ncbi:hypothetical protein P7C73_g2705, partial [Tremellales sp. Uapishka_1]
MSSVDQAATKSSIYQAATLIAYKIPAPSAESEAVDLIKSYIAEFSTEYTTFPVGNGTDDMLQPFTKNWIVADHRKSREIRSVKIQLSDDEWLHPKGGPWAHLNLSALLDFLVNVKGIQCGWAYSSGNDRATSARYVLTPTTTGGPKLTTDRQRLALINMVFANTDTLHPWYLWDSSAVDARGTARGLIQFYSPMDIPTFIDYGTTNIVDNNGNISHTVSFSSSGQHILPYSCATIAAYVGDNIRNRKSNYGVDLQYATELILKRYTETLPPPTAQTYPTIISDYHFSKDDRWFICEPSHIYLANVLCSYPLPGNIFFRTAYTLNDQQRQLDDLTYVAENTPHKGRDRLRKQLEEVTARLNKESGQEGEGHDGNDDVNMADEDTVNHAEQSSASTPPPSANTPATPGRATSSTPTRNTRVRIARITLDNNPLARVREEANETGTGDGDGHQRQRHKPNPPNERPH